MPEMVSDYRVCEDAADDASGGGVLARASRSIPSPTSRSAEGALAEFARLLAPHGQALVAMPLRGSFGSSATCCASTRSSSTTTNVARRRRARDRTSRPTVEMLGAELEEAGFDYVDVSLRPTTFAFSSGRDFFEDPVARLLVLPEVRLNLGLDDPDKALAYVRDAIDKYWSDGAFELTVNVGCATGRAGTREPRHWVGAPASIQSWNICLIRGSNPLLSGMHVSDDAALAGDLQVNVAVLGIAGQHALHRRHLARRHVDHRPERVAGREPHVAGAAAVAAVGAAAHLIDLALHAHERRRVESTRRSPHVRQMPPPSSVLASDGPSPSGRAPRRERPEQGQTSRIARLVAVTVNADLAPAAVLALRGSQSLPSVVDVPHTEYVPVSIVTFLQTDCRRRTARRGPASAPHAA